MNTRAVYVNLKGQEVPLGGLDGAERKLLARLRRRCRAQPDWADFASYWMREVAAFYDARGLTRTQTRQGPVYRLPRTCAAVWAWRLASFARRTIERRWKS